jgi:chemotaxis protein MotB
MAIEEDPPAGVPEWVVTFGDMMSLLLTFFILLFSMSEIKSEQKYRALVDSLRKVFGKHYATMAVQPTRTHARARHRPQTDREKKRLRAKVTDGKDKVEGPEGQREKVNAIQPGHLTVGDLVPFLEGSAELQVEARRRLRAIARELAGKPQKIAVRGHTSRRPLPAGSAYADDWDLAYARCRAVAEYLIAAGVERERIELDVIGAAEPLNRDTDPDAVQRNGRVEVFMLDRLTGQTAPAAERVRATER